MDPYSGRMVEYSPFIPDREAAARALGIPTNDVVELHGQRELVERISADVKRMHVEREKRAARRKEQRAARRRNR